jgi:hypothetical protein
VVAAAVYNGAYAINASSLSMAALWCALVKVAVMAVAYTARRWRRKRRMVAAVRRRARQAAAAAAAAA